MSRTRCHDLQQQYLEQASSRLGKLQRCLAALLYNHLLSRPSPRPSDHRQRALQRVPLRTSSVDCRGDPWPSLRNTTPKTGSFLTTRNSTSMAPSSSRPRASVAPPLSLCETIEKQTDRKLAMATSLTEGNLARCHSQDASPFYQIPVEIRDQIFACATAPFEAMEHPYPETAYWYRPGHRARRKTCTNLLLTCRRVWLETNHLPMRQAEHTFW